jgi:hypothetical protein
METSVSVPDVLLLDLRPAHAMSEIINSIAELDGPVKLLPPNSTSLFQVMDVGLSFHNAVKDQHDL